MGACLILCIDNEMRLYLYDDNFLYIGAKIFEPFQYGKITGHNIQAPYHDNDFEVFIDVSGTTEYYKEFEMDHSAAAEKNHN